MITGTPEDNRDEAQDKRDRKLIDASLALSLFTLAVSVVLSCVIFWLHPVWQ